MAGKERKVPSFSENDMEQIAKIQQDVLNNQTSKSPSAEPPVKPRQMLPSWYARGGSVKKPSFAKGGSPDYGTDYRKGK